MLLLTHTIGKWDTENSNDAKCNVQTSISYTDGIDELQNVRKLYITFLSVSHLFIKVSFHTQHTCLVSN